MRAELTYTIPAWDTDSRAKLELGGGCIMDAGCYCVNTVRFVMGAEPVGALGCQRIKEGYDVDSTFAGLLRFPDDGVAYILTGMEEPFRGCCEVIGTEGRIEVPSLFGGERVTTVVGGEESLREFEPVDRFRAQLEHFSECILYHKRPLFPPEDGLKNTAALVALRRAAQTGREVPIL